jgi:hypothetical protein
VLAAAIDVVSGPDPRNRQPSPEAETSTISWASASETAETARKDCSGQGSLAASRAISSALGFDGEWKPVDPGPEDVGCLFAKRRVCAFFTQRALVGRVGEFMVELGVFESPLGYVVAGGTKDKARDACPVACDQAHRAWLAAGVQYRVVHKVPSKFDASMPQGHDFGVRGRVE